MMLDQNFIVVLVLFMFACQLVVALYRFVMLRSLKKKTIPTLVGFAAIVTSTLFTAIAGTLMFFMNEGNILACEVTILTCIFLYAATKTLLYIFFIERMHIVHKTPAQTRPTSSLYVLNMILLLPYVAIVTLMVLYRIAEVGSDGMCRIGLRHASSIPLLVYDTLFSVYSVAVFVWPLFKSPTLAGSETLKRVAKKNIIGSVVSTVSSFINIFWLYYQKTHTAEGCLLFCTVDVMVNVFVMNYLINGGNKNEVPADTSKDASYHYTTFTKLRCKVFPTNGLESNTTTRKVVMEPFTGVNCQTDEEMAFGEGTDIAQ
jgi:hypothetical protein